MRGPIYSASFAFDFNFLCNRYDNFKNNFNYLRVESLRPEDLPWHDIYCLLIILIWAFLKLHSFRNIVNQYLCPEKKYLSIPIRGIGSWSTQLFVIDQKACPPQPSNWDVKNLKVDYLSAYVTLSTTARVRFTREFPFEHICWQLAALVVVICERCNNWTETWRSLGSLQSTFLLLHREKSFTFLKGLVDIKCLVGSSYCNRVPSSNYVPLFADVTLISTSPNSFLLTEGLGTLNYFAFDFPHGMVF